MTGLLRLEAAAMALLLGVALYVLGPGWWLVLVGLILPDLSMLGYLAGPQFGAKVYNAAHSVIGPAALAIFAVWLGADLPLQIAVIWALHIAIDRALGYGLKYPEDFKQTHLGRIGK